MKNDMKKPATKPSPTLSTYILDNKKWKESGGDHAVSYQDHHEDMTKVMTMQWRIASVAVGSVLLILAFFTTSFDARFARFDDIASRIIDRISALETKVFYLSNPINKTRGVVPADNQ